MDLRSSRKPVAPIKWLAPRRNELSWLCTISLFWCCGMASYNAARAQSAPNLDLSSPTASVHAGEQITTPVTINVGGNIKTVTPGSLLTPAEYVAAVQVANGGRQSLSVAANGTASGGTFMSSSFGALGALNVPNGVTAIHDFGADSSFSIRGNLVNSGNLYGVSTNQSITAGTISATNIINQSSGLISSVLPAGGLAGLTNLINSLDLSLFAANSIINNGRISSSGALNLVAGLSITNGTAPGAGNAGTMASIQSAGNLSMLASTINNYGNMSSLLADINVQTRALTNTGVIAAMNGAASFQPFVGNTLNILNESGTIAARDSVMFGLNSNSNSGVLSLIGGTVSASNASFDARRGVLNIDVVSLPQSVSVNGRDINVTIRAGNGLNLQGINTATSGQLNYTGLGDVTFNGFTTAGGSINVNTTGNISVVPLSTNASGGDIDTSATGNQNPGSVALVTSGGNISVQNIFTGSHGANRDSGDITLIAGQTITAGNLNSSSNTNSHAGNIIVQAGTNGTGDAVLDSANAAQGNSSSADVTITAPDAVIIHGDINAPNGNITIGGSTTDLGGNINIGDGNVNWHLPDTGAEYVLNLDLLDRFGGSNITVGGANYTSDIVLKDNCNGCLSDVDKISIRTLGKYVGEGSNLIFNNDVEFNITAAGGISTGSVTAGSLSFNTDGILAVDGQLNATSDVLLRGGDITVDSSSGLKAEAGDIVLNAANDITLQPGSVIESRATADGTSGGRIGLLAGMPNADINAILDGLNQMRTGNEILLLPEGAAWDPSTNKVNSTGGSIMQVVFPEGAQKSISNSTFNLQGGVVFIDPPGSNNVNITGATITAVGTPITAPGNGNPGGNPGGTPGGTPGGNPGGTPGGTPGGNTGGGGTVTLPTIPVVTTPGSGSGGSGGTTFNAPSGTTGATTSSTVSRDTTNTTPLSVPQMRLSNSLPKDAIEGSNADPSQMRAAIYCAPPGTLKESADLKDNESWIIASNKCQPFSFEGADGSIIIGTGPAIFAPTANRTLLLKEGKLMVISGESMLVVRTPMCNVTIPTNSAATVEFSPTGITRVTGLAGGKASVSVTRQGETIILTAAAGEQMLLAEDTVAASEMQCQPDVPNKKNDNWLVKLSGLHGEKFIFDRTEMVAREGLLNCTLGCFTKLQQAMIDQIRKSMLQQSNNQLKSLLPSYVTKTSPRQLARKLPKSAAHLAAVGFGNILSLQAPELKAIKCTSALIKYSDKARMTILAANKIQLHNGDTLISANADTTILAGKFTVKMAPLSIALVSYRDDHLIVRNIYEHKLTSIQVMTPQQKWLGTQAGHELIIGRQNMSYTRVLSADIVGRRRMRHLDVDDNHSIISSEVSLVSLLQNTDILSQLLRSEHPDDRQVLERVMKMAVALQMTTSKHGNYSIVGQ